MPQTPKEINNSSFTTTTKNGEFELNSENANIISVGEESYFIEADMPAIQASVIENQEEEDAQLDDEVASNSNCPSDTVNGGG